MESVTEWAVFVASKGVLVASGFRVVTVDVMKPGIRNLEPQGQLDAIGTRPQLKHLSDELANHSCTTFSAIWDASVVVILDDLCHQTSSQMKARVWKCVHKLNHAFHRSLSV
jgi:hypothetical protein